MTDLLIWCHNSSFHQTKPKNKMNIIPGYVQSISDDVKKYNMEVTTVNISKLTFKNAIETVLDCIIYSTKIIKHRNRKIVLGGASQCALIIHISANLSNKPAILICPRVLPFFVFHQNISKHEQNTLLKFFKTTDRMKSCQMFGTESPSMKRHIIIALNDDFGSPVETFKNWKKSMTSITTVSQFDHNFSQEMSGDMFLRGLLNLF